MPTTTFTDFKAAIDLLSGSDKKITLKLLMDYISEILDLNSVDMDSFRESRFSHGSNCPYCEGAYVIKYGKKNNQQRYKCKNCDKTFMECTKSVFSKTHLPLKKWLRFVECMVAGFSVRKCAEIVEVCVKTAFYMRHRILDALRLYLGMGHLEGVVEMDETFYAESFKGNHRKSGFILPRKSLKCGKEVKKRGISSEQMCVATAIDRNGNLVLELLCKGRMTTDDLMRLFENRLDKETILCTDSHKSYMSFASKMGVEHKQIPRGRHTLGIYHIQHINSLHEQLKNFTDQFRGISTQYLGNYLYWFKWLQYFKHEKESVKGQSMFLHSASTDIEMTLHDYRDRKPLYV